MENLAKLLVLYQIGYDFQVNKCSLETFSTSQMVAPNTSFAPQKDPKKSNFL